MLASKRGLGDAYELAQPQANLSADCMAIQNTQDLLFTFVAMNSLTRKFHSPAVVVAGALLITGCDKPIEPSSSVEVIRPAQILEITPEDATAKLRFPGRIRASERAELSFNLAGYLASFKPNEGFPVKKGEVVATLEDRVLKARVSAAKAEFDRAKTDLDRYQRLWNTERAVARSEVDDRISKLELAKTNLAAAEQDLADTVLRAPFDGVITRRRVETFASVQAKQPIADLQNLDKLEIVIHVPERTFRTEKPRTQALAVFDGLDDLAIPLTLKSYTTETDPQTQTYEVVLTVDRIPEGLSLLPGMPVTVMPFINAGNDASPEIWIPISAVTTRADKGQFVWSVDQEGVVRPQSIQTGEVRGGQVKVLNGLSANQRIITAGIASLKAGSKVRPLADD